MTAVAIIGCDGAGKSTVAHRLVAEQPVRARYLYMGMNPESSNFSLPTTKLIHARKLRQAQRSAGEAGERPVSLHGIEHRSDGRGKAWALLRLANRIAEELVRQCISSWLQFRGFVVVYDRHFLFDYGAVRPKRLSDRVHRFFLERIYPRPDLVLFLDAPAEVLYERKQEVPISYLEGRRRAHLDQGGLVQHFEIIDATRSPDSVYREVVDRVLRFQRDRGSEPSGGGNE